MNAACLFIFCQIIFALPQFYDSKWNEMSSLFQRNFNFNFRVAVNVKFVFSFGAEVLVLLETRVIFRVQFVSKTKVKDF